MPFELVALSPAVFFALSSTMTRRGLDGSTPHTASLVVLIMQLVFFSSCLVAVDFSRISVSVYWLAFLAAGISSPALSLLFLFRSIQRIGVASTSPIANIHPIFGAFWAFLVLGERPPGVVWLGILVVAGGVYFMSSGGNPLARGRALLLPLTSAAFFGLAHTFRKVGLGGMESLVFGGFLQSVSACALGPLFLKASTGWRPFVFNKASLGSFVLAGLAMAAAQLTLMAALSMGDVSRVSPLVATAPLFVLALAPLILGRRERITPRIVFGALITVAGVILVTSLR
ncbi:MAG: EamA family transporter [Nitrospinae bacterium]|nr:EamA family transporter [Nitrospinota bacterium]